MDAAAVERHTQAALDSLREAKGHLLKLRNVITAPGGAEPEALRRYSAIWAQVTQATTDLFDLGHDLLTAERVPKTDPRWSAGAE